MIQRGNQPEINANGTEHVLAAEQVGQTRWRKTALATRTEVALAPLANAHGLLLDSWPPGYTTVEPNGTPLAKAARRTKAQAQQQRFVMLSTRASRRWRAQR